MDAFPVGRVVALRNLWSGTIVSARPATVVLDGPDSQMLYVSLDSAGMGPVGADGAALRLPVGEWSLRERRWDATHVLSLAWPGEPHAILLFWGAAWEPRCWYVNLQSPLRRTTVGFDYTDLLLDAVVAPDRSSWEWKDEDELAEAIRYGLIPAQDEARLRTEGEALVRGIQDREPPFDRDWWDWRPDPSWPAASLPPEWDRISA